MYNLRFAKAEQARKAITNQQLKQIRDMYQEIADQYSKRIENLSDKTNISSILRTQYLREYQKQLADELGKVNRRIESNIKSGMTHTAEAVLEEEIRRAKDLGFAGITGKYSNIPTDVVETIISGQLYQGDWSLSSAIWGTNEKIKRDCQSIVARGIAQNKGVYDVAKDLEAYVNPSARKTYRWARDYPGSNKVIDYNASRLARTMMSHAYQEAFERSTEKDPWVDAYKWNISANDRVCPLCIGRAENDEYGLGEGVYPKGEVPLDHPNGQCFLTIVQTKSTKDVVNDLANWYNGTGDKNMNDAIDQFAQSLGYKPEMLKRTVKKNVNANIAKDIHVDAEAWNDTSYLESLGYSKDDAQYMKDAMTLYIKNPAKVTSLGLDDKIDELLEKLPKWKGEVYRGLVVDENTTYKIGQTISENKISSWTSEKAVAREYSGSAEFASQNAWQLSKGKKSVIFRVSNSGGSSISRFHSGGKEIYHHEVVTPSNVSFEVVNVEEVIESGERKIQYVYLKPKNKK